MPISLATSDLLTSLSTALLAPDWFLYRTCEVFIPIYLPMNLFPYSRYSNLTVHTTQQLIHFIQRMNSRSAIPPMIANTATAAQNNRYARMIPPAISNTILTSSLLQSRP